MLSDGADLLRRFEDIAGAPSIPPNSSRYVDFRAEIEIPLPDDYLAWASRYSTIEVCNELLVTNLISTREQWSTKEDYSTQLDGLRLTRDIVPERIDVLDEEARVIGPSPWLPIFPEIGGLFPWGNDRNAVLYMWDTRRDDPNQWTIVLYDGTWCEFNCGFLQFLVNLLSGEYRNSPMFLKCWPWLPAFRELEGDFADGPQWHVPWKWRPYYLEYERKLGGLEYSEESLSWTEQFR